MGRFVHSMPVAIVLPIFRGFHNGPIMKRFTASEAGRLVLRMRAHVSVQSIETGARREPNGPIGAHAQDQTRTAEQFENQSGTTDSILFSFRFNLFLVQL